MSPSEIVQISIHKALLINYNFCILGGKENTETFPESSLILPPLPVLGLTLWYPTYIRKQLIRRRGGEGWGRSEKNAAPNVAAPPTGKDNEYVQSISLWGIFIPVYSDLHFRQLLCSEFLQARSRTDQRNHTLLNKPFKDFFLK